MKRLLQSTSLTLVLSGVALAGMGLSGALAQEPAQAPATANSPQATGKGYHHGHHHAQDPQKQAEFLSKKLNLTPDQTAKIEPILADHAQKLAALKGNTSLSQDEMRQQMRSIHQDTRQQLSTVLTPEQLEQMKSARHHGHRGPNQSQPLNQPQGQSTPPSGQ